jgi:uncharacterized membrane protein (UPF0136 family)
MKADKSSRAVKTRAPIPATVAVLAAGSTAYYAREILEHPKGRL